MLGSMFDKMHMNGIAAGLDTASVKNSVIAENIANMDTPGYKSKDIKFFDVMAEELGQGKKLPLERTNEKHIPPSNSPVDIASFVYQQNNPSVRNDGNDVNIDYEMSQMAENTIRYNMLSEIASHDFTRLKEVIQSK